MSAVSVMGVANMCTSVSARSFEIMFGIHVKGTHLYTHYGIVGRRL